VATKKTAKKAAKKTTGVKKKGGPPVPGVNTPCNLKNVCNYLEDLSIYLQKLTVDYKGVKKAVCNLDHQVFGTGGTLADRLCTGAATGEPADPPNPPVW
jgi:hypothetical protein